MNATEKNKFKKVGLDSVYFHFCGQLFFFLKLFVEKTRIPLLT